MALVERRGSLSSRPPALHQLRTGSRAAPAISLILSISVAGFVLFGVRQMMTKSPRSSRPENALPHFRNVAQKISLQLSRHVANGLVSDVENLHIIQLNQGIINSIIDLPPQPAPQHRWKTKVFPRSCSTKCSNRSRDRRGVRSTFSRSEPSLGSFDVGAVVDGRCCGRRGSFPMPPPPARRRRPNSTAARVTWTLHRRDQALLKSRVRSWLTTARNVTPWKTLRPADRRDPDEVDMKILGLPSLPLQGICDVVRATRVH